LMKLFMAVDTLGEGFGQDICRSPRAFLLQCEMLDLEDW